MVQSRMWKFRDKAARAEAASFFTPKAYPGCGSCYMVLERVDVEGEVPDTKMEEEQVPVEATVEE